MDQFFVWLQNFLSQLAHGWLVLFATISKEPVAWLALFVSVIFGIANYRLARKKYLEESAERASKTFTLVAREAYRGFVDREVLAVCNGKEKLNHHNIPQFITTRLELSNQSLKPYYVYEISFWITCRDLENRMLPFVIPARHLPEEKLSHEAQIVFLDVTTKKPIVISSDNPLPVGPGSTFLLDAIIFVSDGVRDYYTDAPSEASNVWAFLSYNEGTIFDIPRGLVLLPRDKRAGQEPFLRIQKQYADLLQSGLERDKHYPAIQLW